MYEYEVVRSALLYSTVLDESVVNENNGAFVRSFKVPG
jgi:hypothetical protein